MPVARKNHTAAILIANHRLSNILQHVLMTTGVGRELIGVV